MDDRQAARAGPPAHLGHRRDRQNAARGRCRAPAASVPAAAHPAVPARLPHLPAATRRAFQAPANPPAPATRPAPTRCCGPGSAACGPAASASRTAAENGDWPS
ncbi:hypothetical protein G6F46_014643 [Rhizopus delemar]|nr:hypothetical protein G6F32_015254 [Rhizopus arrhizus]KAG1589331.1 hypothetical protein G6F46_014643 [Rhizopus delemar]